MANVLKSDEELKEYLENLGTEYKFTCFKEKNAEGCHLLGDYLEAVKSDVEASAKIFKSNCDDRNYSKSCYKFGTISYLGKGTKADCKQALAYYKKACDLNHQSACLHAGVLLSEDDDTSASNNPVELDFSEGLKLLEKACTLGEATACFIASLAYLKGAKGVAKDKARSAELCVPACNGGNLYACMNLSRFYKLGDGVPKDEKLSEMYKQKARDIRDDERVKPPIGLQQGT